MTLFPQDQELQPVEPVRFYRTRGFDADLKSLFGPPCSPPASQPAAEPAEPSAPSQEGSGTAVGVGGCCERMRSFYYHWVLDECSGGEYLMQDWILCPWCGDKIKVGE